MGISVMPSIYIQKINCTSIVSGQSSLREVYVKKACGFSWPEAQYEVIVRMRLPQTFCSLSLYQLHSVQMLM